MRAGLIQPGDSPERRAAVRKQAKTVVLGVQYGQEAEGMASRAGMTVPMAREMLQRHKRRYKAFWRRYEEAAAAGVNGIPITLVLGWRIRQGPWLGVEDERPPNPRSFANFPIQGTGSEILRAATVSLRRAGFDIPALIHDATLTEHDQAHVEERAALVAEIMGDASEAVLGPGRRIRSDIEIIPKGSGIGTRTGPPCGASCATFWEWSHERQAYRP